MRSEISNTFFSYALNEPYRNYFNNLQSKNKYISYELQIILYLAAKT